MLDRILRVIKRLSRRGRKAVRKATRAYRLKPGLPEGLTEEEMRDLSREVHGKGVRETWFVHLSGWKDAGAFALVVKLEGGQTWKLIYKNAFYGQDQIPALKGFPALPGPPEFAVYANCADEICRYLPAVYRCEEVQAGCQYRYFLEDLNSEYHTFTGERTLKQITGQMAEFHRALAEWGGHADLSGFIRYDAAFSSALREYTLASLEQYQRGLPNEKVRRFLDEWLSISALHADPGFDVEGTLQPVHGDLNWRNVMWNKRRPSEFKLLDWEWAGWSQPHADLVSVTKHMPAELAARALTAYAATVPGFSLAEHQRIFEWHRLERGLIDASFMAKQVVEAPPKTRMNVVRFIEDSLDQTFEAASRLRSAERAG